MRSADASILRHGFRLRLGEDFRGRFIGSGLERLDRVCYALLVVVSHVEPQGCLVGEGRRGREGKSKDAILR